MIPFPYISDLTQTIVLSHTQTHTTVTPDSVPSRGRRLPQWPKKVPLSVYCSFHTQTPLAARGPRPDLGPVQTLAVHGFGGNASDAAIVWLVFFVG